MFPDEPPHPLGLYQVFAGLMASPRWEQDGRLQEVVEWWWAQNLDSKHWADLLRFGAGDEAGLLPLAAY